MKYRKDKRETLFQHSRTKSGKVPGRQNRDYRPVRARANSVDRYELLLRRGAMSR